MANPSKKSKNEDLVSLTKYSGTNKIKLQIKLSVELSLHTKSLIDTKKRVHVARGDMEVLLVIYQVSEELRDLAF